MLPLNLVYRHRPPAIALEGPAPAVVLVHGWLGNEDVMWAFQSALPHGAFAFSPRAPVPVPGGFGWFRDREPADPAFAEGLAALRDFVAGLHAAFPIDPARIVLVGFSQGAAVSGALALAEPERVRAAALLAGFLPEPARPWAAPGRLAGKAVFIAHGEQDEIVPVGQARAARAILQAAGAEVTYGEYPAGHKLTIQGMRDLRDWLARSL